LPLERKKIGRAGESGMTRLESWHRRIRNSRKDCKKNTGGNAKKNIPKRLKTIQLRWSEDEKRGLCKKWGSELSRKTQLHPAF